MRYQRRRLVWQLYPAFLLILLLVIVAVSWSILADLRNFHYRQTSQDLLSRTQLIADQLSPLIAQPQPSELAQQVALLSKSSATRITVVQSDGRVLADSEENPRLMDNHAQRPEILATADGGEGMSLRFSRTLGQTLMYVALPLRHNGQRLGTIRTSVALSALDRTFADIYRKLLLGGLMIAFLAAPLCWILARRISRPLEQMTAGAQRFAEGDFSLTLKEKGSWESRQLAAAMNQMAHKLSLLIEREIGQRSEIEAILGCMVEGLIAIGADGRIIRLNRSAIELFKLSGKQVVGRSVPEVIRLTEVQKFIQRALAQKGPLEEELTLPGAQPLNLHAQAAPLTGAADVRGGVLVILHDLTRLRRLESVRKDFVANVSHELKTPITAIRGAVETLLDDADDPAAQPFLQIIFKQNERLNALVEDLLDLSRIEQGSGAALELQLAPLLPLLENSATTCASLLKERAIGLQIDCPPGLQLRMNLSLLEQAVVNLLSNAIKYSDDGGQVRILVKEAADFVSIDVQDDGCGIAKEHLPRLFERFYRVDRARSRKLGGTGLGLAIVKHVVQAHKGDITVASHPGEGSTFTLLLPR